MAKKPKHVIQRHVFDVEIDSKDQANRVFSEFTDLFYKVVVPILEKIFDEYDSEDEIIRLDSLELDLGHLNPKMLEQEIQMELERKLRRALVDKIAMLPPKQITTKDKEGRIPLTRSKIELLLFVLQNGNLPPWVDRSNYNPKELVVEVLSDDRHQFIAQFIALAVEYPMAIRRFVTQFPIESVELLVDSLFINTSPLMRRFVRSISDDLQAHLGGTSQAKRDAIAREAFLKALIMQANQPFNRGKLVSSIRQVLRDEYPILPQQILQDESLSDAEEDELQRQIRAAEAQVLFIEARDVLSGKTKPEEWLALPLDLRVRLWEYLLKRMGAEAVNFLLSGFRLEAGISASSIPAQVWKYLLQYHTDSLRTALENSSKLLEAVKMAAPAVDAQLLPELLEWVLPGREGSISLVLEKIQRIFRGLKGQSMTDAQVREEVLRAITQHYADTGKTDFSPEETLKALQGNMREVPKEVLEGVVENKDDFRPQNYNDLPPLLEQALRLSDQEELFRFLRHVLLFGDSPWWSTYSLGDFERELVKASTTSGSPIKELFQSLIIRANTPSQQRSVVNVLTEQLSEASLLKVLEGIEPGVAGFMVTVQKTIQGLFGMPAAPSLPSGEYSNRVYPWKPVLQYLIFKGRKETQTSEMVDFVIYQLAADLRKTRAEVMALLMDTVMAGVARGEMRFMPMQSMLMSQMANDAMRVPEALSKEEEVRITQMQKEREIAIETEAKEKARKKALEDILAGKLGKPEDSQWREEYFGPPPGGISDEAKEEWLARRTWLIESGAGEKVPSSLSEDELEVWRKARQERIIWKWGNSSAYQTDSEGFILTDANGRPLLRDLQQAEAELRAIHQALQEDEEDDRLREAELAAEETWEEIKKQKALRDKEAEMFQQSVQLSEEDLLPGKPFDILIQFLHTGTIPTEYGNISKLEFENMILALVDTRSRELRAILQDKLRNLDIRRRLVKGLPLLVQEELIRLLKPAYVRNLMEFSEQIAQVFARSGSPISPDIIREHRFYVAVNSRNYSFSPVLYVRELIAYASKQASKDYFGVLLWLDEQLNVLSSGMGEVMERVASIVTREKMDMENLTPEVRKERQEQLIEPEKKKEEKVDSKKDPIYIQNAGIVIFARLLPYFFKNLGLMDPTGEAFTGPVAKERAVFLLHNLLFFKREMEEVELALNKIMVGMEPSDPVTGPMELTEQEEKEIETLFKVVSSRWPYMANKTPDEVRGTVLLREGRLKWDQSNILSGHWNLRVQQKPYDTILSNYPYPFSEIKFPWMETKLIVDWT